MEGAEQLNVTIKAFKGEDGSPRIVITGIAHLFLFYEVTTKTVIDTGIGMTQEELTSHLVSISAYNNELLLDAVTRAHLQNPERLSSLLELKHLMAQERVT